MALIVNRIMQEKGMFLKNNLYLLYFIIIFFLLSFYKTSLATDEKTNALNYLLSLNNFSASFLQNDGKNLSEGKVYIGQERVRAEYFSPNKILIVLDENKAMYFNYELEEDEFFNPKDTNAWFFYDIFRNPLFFKDGLAIVKNNELIIEKRGLNKNEEDFLIKIYFEKRPLVFRSVEVFINDDFLKLSIYNHNYNEDFDKNFFKLISPKLSN